MDSGLGLCWASVWSSHVPAFLLFILIYLILPLCHSLGPSYAALKFANPEYITVSGKATSFLSYSWHWDLPLFSTCPQNNCGILLSSEISKRKKKSNLLKVMHLLRLSFLPFLVLTSSWITAREGAVTPILSNKSLSEYKKFKWKITLKERRLFLLI